MVEDRNIQKAVKAVGTKSPSMDFTLNVMASIQELEMKKAEKSTFDIFVDRFESWIFAASISVAVILLGIFDYISKDSFIKDLFISSTEIQLPQLDFTSLIPSINFPTYIIVFILVIPILILVDRFLSQRFSH